MPVYVDQLRDWGWKLGPSCHMIADTLDELHAFAALLGLRYAWFQHKSISPHYDLTAGRRAAAVKRGAIECDRKVFVDHIRRIRLEQAPGGKQEGGG